MKIKKFNEYFLAESGLSADVQEVNKLDKFFLHTTKNKEAREEWEKFADEELSASAPDYNWAYLEKQEGDLSHVIDFGKELIKKYELKDEFEKADESEAVLGESKKFDPLDDKYYGFKEGDVILFDHPYDDPGSKSKGEIIGKKYTKNQNRLVVKVLEPAGDYTKKNVGKEISVDFGDVYEMVKESIDSSNAKAFNSSLKKAFKEEGMNVKIRIVNSYKFPNCWVEVHPDKPFSNEFRLRVFDSTGKDRKDIGNINDVSYGNIQANYIAAKVHEWMKVFDALKEGNIDEKLSKGAREFISKKIKVLMDEGRPAKQAQAMAYSYARREGFDVDESELLEKITTVMELEKDKIYKMFDKSKNNTIAYSAAKYVGKEGGKHKFMIVNRPKPSPILMSDEDLDGFMLAPSFFKEK